MGNQLVDLLHLNCLGPKTFPCNLLFCLVTSNYQLPAFYFVQIFLYKPLKPLG